MVSRTSKGPVIILIMFVILGGIILWGALTGWTFSGTPGDAERDSPPGPISDVQVEVAAGESGGRRESYTTLDEMAGLYIAVSFNTPKSSFGRGNSALKDYVISLGTASNNSRGSLLAVILISREGGSARLISRSFNNTSGGIALSGDFNALDSRVSVTLSSPVWRDGGIIIPEGGVFLGIDYTPMSVPEGRVYTWSQATADKPVSDDTRYFVAGGVTLLGEVKDGVRFVVDPDVTNSINEELIILYFRNGLTCNPTSTVPNAAEYHYQDGVCVVKSCAQGYNLSQDGSACAPAIYFKTGNTTVKAIQIDGKPGNFNEIELPDSVDNVIVPDGFGLDLWRNGAWDPCSYITGNILPNRGKITHWNVKPLSDIANDKFCAPRCTSATEDCLIAASYVRRGPPDFTHPSGYRLVMQGDGNLVIYKSGQPTWATGTNGSGATKYFMEGDGNLVLYDNSASPKWASGTSSSDASKRPYGLYMNGNGRLAIKDKDNNTVWTNTHTYTILDGPRKDRPGHRIGPLITNASLSRCKQRCDEDDDCVGISHVGTVLKYCRLNDSGALDVDPVNSMYTFYKKNTPTQSSCWNINKSACDELSHCYWHKGQGGPNCRPR